MELRVLGEVEAWGDNGLVDLGPARQRCVLAALLVEVNQVVSAERIAERVWGERVLPTARKTLSSYVSRLRGALASLDGAALLQRSGGYVLVADRSSVDLYEFRRLRDRARDLADAPAEAVRVYSQALALWRGDALNGLGGDWAAEERDRLHQERFAVECDLVDARLALGQATELLPELAARTARHTLDERVAGQYMLALHRAGRAAEALEHYRLLRARLVEELGADPGPALRDLHQRLLTGDPKLVVRAVNPVVVPRQLPGDVVGFSGRVLALAELDEQLPDTSRVLLVSGTGGVGKTALAVHWAHQVRHLFPDGQLHVDLRGYDQGEPADPTDVLARFLQALGVHSGDIPTDPDERATSLRSLLADKRVLLLLDNARTAEQVRPLLPGSAGCLTLVTSRDALTGLVVADGARRLPLDLFDAVESRVLLRTLLGARVDAEADAVDELIGQCAGLPLALRLAADLAARRHRTPLSRLITELADEHDRLDRLDAGTDPRTAMRAVFSWSYKALTEPGARLFRLLGLAPGPDLDAHGCAALLGTSIGVARRTLDELARAHLVEEHSADRFKSHDLLRAYARTRAEEDEPPPERDAAVHRLVEYHLHTAYGAERTLDPLHTPVAIPLSPAAPEVPVRTFPDTATALDWFAAELDNLLAAQACARARGWHAEVVQFAAAMRSALYRGSLWREYMSTQLAAAESAQLLGHRVAEAVCRGVLTQAYAKLRDYDRALRNGHRGLSLARESGDLLVHAKAHRALAWAYHHQGAYRDALDHCEQALELARAAADQSLEGDLLNGMGWIYTALDDYHRALPLCEQAVELGGRVGDRELEGPARHSLGYIHLRLGNHTEARDNFLIAAEHYEALGLHAGIVEAYHNLGDTYAEMGETAPAETAWRHALDTLDDPANPTAVALEARLAALTSATVL